MTTKDDDKTPGPAVRVEIHFGAPIPKDGVKVSRGVRVEDESGHSELRNIKARLERVMSALRKMEEAMGYLDDVFLRQRISRPPGIGIQSVADILCSKNTMKGVVEPSIADMQAEYCEALNEERRFKTVKVFFVRMRGYASIVKALGFQHVLKVLWEMWRSTLAK